MNRFVILLRSVNVGGRNKLSMTELQEALRAQGFAEVKTWLNSGNVVLTSEQGPDGLAASVSGLIRDRFALTVPVAVIRQERLAEMLAGAPDWWGTEDPSIYDNLILPVQGVTVSAVTEALGEPTASLERVGLLDDAVFWSFDRQRYAKANWWKRSAAPGVGELITIRTANTVRKLAGL